MRYASVCSGIEAATVAWHPLGWEPVAFSEIEWFPSAVLKHHYPDVPNLGDMTRYRDWGLKRGSAQLIVGGTPCQSFSVAGLRKGLDDPRGNLALVFLGLVDHLRPSWVVWENVPGVCSSTSGEPASAPPDRVGVGHGEQVVDECEYDETSDFGCFLAALAELGYGWAYRVLDAQYVRVDGFGRAVPQRRRRVFVVGYSGDWRRAAAVLFERESLSGHPPPRREAGQAAPTVPSRGTAGGGLGTDFDCDGGLCIAAPGLDMPGVRRGEHRDRSGQAPTDVRVVQSRDGGLIHCPPVSPAMKARDYKGASSDGDGDGLPMIAHSLTGRVGNASRQAGGNGNLVAHSLRAEGHDASEDGTGRGVPLVAQALTAEMYRSGGATAGNNPGVRNVLAVDMKQVTSKANGSVPQPVSPTLHRDGTVYAIRTAQTGANGHGISSEAAHTLDGANGQAVVAPALTAANNPSRSPQSSEVTQQIVAVAAAGYGVRRLTPRECERLMGFPDDYTLIPYRGKPAADGPRYKALGNSMAVNVMRWIGTRIQLVEEGTVHA